ncbi:hypothetical protein RB369 [Rhodopirellula baltica SH 1]|uniref:Uncharacterized protein n=1 Tax=Rhodopirellula baltica (strain DSM 10527 / NCIMB 13988 / SH1) TaxID=243090 RepID=Q7UYV2_RHOBA|nr:hypothetical protein RB369 [Rhodopirellula baltica SH 1]
MPDAGARCALLVLVVRERTLGGVRERKVRQGGSAVDWEIVGRVGSA